MLQGDYDIQRNLEVFSTHGRKDHKRGIEFNKTLVPCLPIHLLQIPISEVVKREIAEGKKVQTQFLPYCILTN